IDKNNFEIVSGPDVITRGFIYVRESEALINEINNLSRNKLDECLKNQIIEWQVLKSGVKKSVEQLLYDKTKRRPSVFPIIMEV
ncbi:MAG: ribonuclease J, partial [Erysipelotrichaceae bacterium]